MRYALLSDIHGNLEALHAVLTHAAAQSIDRYVCLGDVVGYGPDPVPCIKTVRRVVRWSLCGNHDAAMFMSHAIGFNEGAARAVAWQREQMHPRFYSLPGKVARWRWMENLPAQRQEGRVLYVHASPRDPLMEYVLEKDFQDMGFGPSQKAVEMFEPRSFSVLDVENLRLHYAKTLEHWLERYERSVDLVSAMFDQEFVRAWRLYLSGSLASFRAGWLQLFQVTFARASSNRIPWSRSYLYRDLETRPRREVSVLSRR